MIRTNPHSSHDDRRDMDNNTRHICVVVFFVFLSTHNHHPFHQSTRIDYNTRSIGIYNLFEPNNGHSRCEPSATKNVWQFTLVQVPTSHSFLCVRYTHCASIRFIGDLVCSQKVRRVPFTSIAPRVSFSFFILPLSYIFRVCFHCVWCVYVDNERPKKIR